MSSLIAARDSVNDPTWQTFSFPYVITSAMNFSRQVQSQLLTSSNSLEIDFVVWMLVPKNILKITELWMICSEMAAGRIVFLVMEMDSVMTCGNKAYSSIILHKTSCWLLCSMLTIQLKKRKTRHFMDTSHFSFTDPLLLTILFLFLPLRQHYTHQKIVHLYNVENIINTGMCHYVHVL